MSLLYMSLRRIVASELTVRIHSALHCSSYNFRGVHQEPPECYTKRTHSVMCHSDEMCDKDNALGHIIILDTLSRSANNVFYIRRYYICLQTSVIMYLHNKILQR